VVILRRSRAAQNRNLTSGKRLLAHSRDHSDYRLLVGLPAAKPRSWAEVDWMDEHSVGLKNSEVLYLDQVTAYLVTYPSGMVADCQCPDDLPLPSWVKSPTRPPRTAAS
jgi:hypothetical protein